VSHVLWCKRTKLRGSPKALITKDKKETSYPASLMPEGIVILLEILEIGMGYRGSKSVTFEMITVKEQRVDGSSYSMCLDCVRCTLVAGKSVLVFTPLYYLLHSYRDRLLFPPEEEKRGGRN
jgi:hypothetical protein